MSAREKYKYTANEPTYILCVKNLRRRAPLSQLPDGRAGIQVRTCEQQRSQLPVKDVNSQTRIASRMRTVRATVTGILLDTP